MVSINVQPVRAAGISRQVLLMKLNLVGLKI